MLAYPVYFTKKIIIDHNVLNRGLLLIEILFVFLFSILNLAVYDLNGHWASLNLMVNDGASVVVSAISHNYGLGIPYKDYWEYRPPGFLMLIDIWVKIFGSNISAFKLLELLLRFGIGLEICLIARKIFSPLQAFFASVFTCFVFFSPLFGTMLLVEPYGLFFSLLGLLVLFSVKRIQMRYFFATFFVFLSSQMKDPYAITVLIFVPSFVYIFLSRKYLLFVKMFISVFLGFGTAFLILWGYLNILGSWEAYIEMFLHKSTTYQIRIWENFGYFLNQYRKAFISANDLIFNFSKYLIPILVVWIFIFILSSIKKRPFSDWFKTKDDNVIILVPSICLTLRPETRNSLVMLFFTIGAFTGFFFNKGFAPHYLVIIVVPLCFFWLAVFFSIESNLKHVFKVERKKTILIPIFLLLLIPNKIIIDSYQNIPFNNVLFQAYSNFTLPDGDTTVEKYINEKTSISDCIVSLYGWKSSEPNLYSRRRPCSRIIQANMVTSDLQKLEYREAILNNPPKVIVYSLEGADMDILKFDREVLNYTGIIKKCYKIDNKYSNNGRWSLQLYFPIYSNDNLKNCIRKNAFIPLRRKPRA